jgi:ferredoxin
VGDHVNDVARRIVAELDAHGVAALNPAMAFPMELTSGSSKSWIVSHKRVAQAAGLGRMGLHRNLIHPRFGSFVLLGTVLVDAMVDECSRPIDFNPCVDCKLCVAACPVGAIGSDGAFNFSSCFTHNYREFMGGFSDWVETLVESRDRADYRRRVSDAETWSVWQSLSYGPNYKAAYCMAVCPAGEDVIGPFLQDRAGHLRQVVKPLQEKVETVYVVAGSDAEAHVTKRFPHKRRKRVGNGLRSPSIAAFLANLPLVFQRGPAAGLDATYHFVFTGDEPAEATVTIRDQTISVRQGLEGSPDLHMTADSRTWIRFLAKEASMPLALLRRRIRLRGSPKLLLAFGRCFR